MKKVFITAMVAAAIMATSCGNKTTANVNAEDSTSMVDATVSGSEDKVIDEMTKQIENGDAESLKTTIEGVSEEYAKLVEEGKLDEAKSYASKVKEFINTHSEELNTLTSGNVTITQLVNAVKNLPTDVKTTAEEAAAAVKTDAENVTKTVADDVKKEAQNKVDEAKSNAKDKASKAVNNSKNKATEAINDANKKATDAINKAADKLLNNK